LKIPAAGLFRLSGRYSFARTPLRVAAAVGGALLALLLYVAIFGIAIDASGMRNDVAVTLTQSLGRQVRFDGPLQIEISARPKLRVGALHIANAPGFDGGDFARLGEARLALNLWALLRLRLQVEELAGSDVHVRLQMNNKGSNWTFNSATRKQESPQARAAQTSRGAAEGALERLDIKRVSLENLDVEFIGVNGKSHYFELQSLAAQLPAGQPLTLALRGTVEKTHPYKLEFTGGAFADLMDLDEPWPVDLSLEFMNSRLALKGNVSGAGATINFGLGTENLNEFERLLQTRLPRVGVAGISGSINYVPGKVAVEKLNGVMGKTTLAGSLNFDYGGEKPMVQGALTLPTLDLRPFMSDKPSAQEEPSRSLADTYGEIADASFSLKQLNDINADLILRVGQWVGLPSAVQDATLQVKIAQGRLSMPLQATVAGVALSGAASADASVTPARFKLALGGRHAGQANMAGVRGELGRFDLRIAARGDHGAELVKSLDVQLDVERARLAYGGEGGRSPVNLTLEKLALALPAGKGLQGRARGSLLDTPFSATLRGGSFTAIMREDNTPIDFELQAGSARAEVHALLQPPTEGSGSKIDFGLSAPRSGEIARWLGLKPGADAPVNLRGNFHVTDHSWHLADFTVQLGRTRLGSDVQRTYANGKSLIQLQLSADLIDLEELQSLLPGENEAAPAAPGTGANLPAAANLIDVPILPNGISLADADITVRIKRIASASPFAVRDLRFDGHVRDGMMLASPFAANVAETDFSGAITLDLRTRQPHSVLWLSADGLDIGRIMTKLGMADHMDAGVDHLRLQLDLHSSRLGTLLAQSELALNFEGGHLTLHDANTGATMRIALDSGVLISAPGAPVNLELFGSVDKAPVYIGIQTAKAADLIAPNLPVPFKLNASTSGAAVQLVGDIDRPFSKRDIELVLDMSGSRLDNLNALARVSLPPWGPWAASGKFHMSSAGYEVSSLQLQVGSSILNGEGKLDTKAQPPRMDVALKAPTIQLGDFRFGDWSPEKSKSTAKAETRDAPLQSGDAANSAQQILSAEVLRRQNAHLKVEVNQVVSGQDMLGNGKLEARLENGRAEIGPVVVNTPGGSAQFSLAYEPGEKGVALNLQAEIKHFDYGILARRLDPTSEMRGTFSLDVDVNARADQFSQLMRYGHGHVDFAVWPENFKAGLLDLWAVNVLVALLPNVDSSHESKVNCAVGRFALNNGVLSDKSIFIDTSRMRVAGKGKVNFAGEEIQLYMQPRAKKPQFLSLAIPIELGGTFNDFHVGVRPVDVLETVTQFAMPVVWMPLQMLFGKEPPADGHDVCAVENFG
jgi:uncharacterized protein involved in outer membrane biogenesis